jgi:hypothetical protein
VLPSGYKRPGSIGWLEINSDGRQAFASELFAYLACIVRVLRDFCGAATTLVARMASTLVVSEILFQPVHRPVRLAAFLIFILAPFGFMLRRADNGSLQIKRSRDTKICLHQTKDCTGLDRLY